MNVFLPRQMPFNHKGPEKFIPNITADMEPP